MKSLTAFQAHEILSQNPTALLVDVREPSEVAELAVPGAKHIPLGDLPDRIGELAGYTDIFFMCRSGGRSSQAAAYAESVGIKNVYNISGGIIGWNIAGLPTTY